MSGNGAFLALALAGLMAGPVMAQSDDLPEGLGKAELQSACSHCHAVSLVTRKPRSAEEWSRVMTWMVDDLGADVAVGARQAILAYLNQHYGRPTAPAEDSAAPRAPEPRPQGAK